MCSGIRTSSPPPLAPISLASTAANNGHKSCAFLSARGSSPSKPELVQDTLNYLSPERNQGKLL